MPDLERIQRDKATILSIIKYAMFAVIAAAVVYYGFRLVWILLPFVIGLILARVARQLACLWLDLGYRIRSRRTSRSAEQANSMTAPALTTGRRKIGRYPHGLATSRKETKAAIVFYVLEVILVIGLIIGVIAGSISQLRSLAVYLPALIRDSDLSRRISTLLSDLSERLGGLFRSDFLQAVENELSMLQQRLIQAVPGIASGILNGLGAIIGYLPILFFIVIVVIMSGYYFITDSRNLYRFMRRNITSKVFREKSIRLVNSLSTTLFRVIGGFLLLLIITFIEALTGLLIIGMPYAVIIALVCAVVDFLPVFGISTTLIPVAAFLFINGNIIGGLGALVLLLFMTLSRRVIEPPILGNAMSLHPMATLAAMIIGIALYGLGGIIIGPIILVIAKEVMSLFGFDQKIRSIIGEVLNKVSS